MPHAIGKHFQMSRKRAIATGSGRAWQGPETALCRSFGASSPAARPAKSRKTCRIRPGAWSVPI